MRHRIETANTIPADVLSYLTENFGHDIECVLRKPRTGDSLLIRANLPHMLHNIDQLNNPKPDTLLRGVVKISDTDRNPATTILAAELAVCLGFSLIKTDGQTVYVSTEEPVVYINSPVHKISNEILTNIVDKKDTKMEELAHIDMDALHTLLDSQNIEKNEVSNLNFVWTDIEQMQNGSTPDFLRLHAILNSKYAKPYRSVLFEKGSVISPVYGEKGGGHTLDLVIYGSVAATGK